MAGFQKGSVRALACVALLLGSLSTVSAHEASCAAGEGGGEWPRFGNQLNGDRTQDKEFFLNAARAATLQPAWTFDANRWTYMNNNEITGYPVIADGCVYVGSSTGTQSTGGVQAPGWVFALNADDGDLVWKTQVDGGVYSTLTVEDGIVYAFVSRVGEPFVAALDQDTGKILWETVVDRQIGSDAVSSPIVYDGVVWVGLSGTAAEVGDEGERLGFQGSQVFLEAGGTCTPSQNTTCGEGVPAGPGGSIITKTWTIPPELWEDDYSGGAVWSTISIDTESGFGYVGSGNPFDYNAEHVNTNAILKVDMNRTLDDGITPNPAFGDIVDAYKGDVEEYFPEAADVVPCEELEEADAVNFLGIECLRFDLDFGAQPNIFKVDGTTVIGLGQKSGVYHILDAETMGEQINYKQLLGFPSAVGGIVGSAAFDGESLYGPHTIGGYLWSIDKDDAAVRWITPIGDAVHWGNPVTYANHVLYTADLKGFLNAYDAQTGTQLLALPMSIGSDTRENPTFTWGGVTVARHTVYASIGVGLTSAGMPSMPNGFVIAYRPLPNPLP